MPRAQRSAAPTAASPLIPAASSNDPAVADLYQRPEHLYIKGPVQAHPGSSRNFPWGRLVVLPLPKPCEEFSEQLQKWRTLCCSGCGYALHASDEELLETIKCDRCLCSFHADDFAEGEEEPCFGPRGRGSALSGERFCSTCLVPGPRESEQRNLLKLVSDFQLWNFTRVSTSQTARRLPNLVYILPRHVSHSSSHYPRRTGCSR